MSKELADKLNAENSGEDLEKFEELISEKSTDMTDEEFNNEKLNNTNNELKLTKEEIEKVRNNEYVPIKVKSKKDMWEDINR